MQHTPIRDYAVREAHGHFRDLMAPSYYYNAERTRSSSAEGPPFVIPTERSGGGILLPTAATLALGARSLAEPVPNEREGLGMTAGFAVQRRPF